MAKEPTVYAIAYKGRRVTRYRFTSPAHAGEWVRRNLRGTPVQELQLLTLRTN